MKRTHLMVLAAVVSSVAVACGGDPQEEREDAEEAAEEAAEEVDEALDEAGEEVEEAVDPDE